jgi:hypothetical protein
LIFCALSGIYFFQREKIESVLTGNALEHKNQIYCKEVMGSEQEYGFSKDA